MTRCISRLVFLVQKMLENTKTIPKNIYHKIIVIVKRFHRAKPKDCRVSFICYQRL